MKCKESYCQATAEIGEYCNRHYYYSEWLDNRDKNNLGIIKFAKAIVPEWMRNTTPSFHQDVYYEFMQMYNPKNRDKYDRLLGEIAFRGAAKTTRAKIILLYVCCFSIEKLVIYASETHTFALQDVVEVQRELTENSKIRYYFGPINSKKVRGQSGEWIKGAFLTVRSPYLPPGSGTFVLARGVGQQVRSALRNSYRPTLAIINDMYGKDSVKTEMSRADYAKWFFTELFNAVDDIDGKMYFNGTVLHQDTVPVTIMSNPQWKTFEYPVMDIDDFYRAVAACKIQDDKIILPSDEDIHVMQKGMSLTWPDRFDLRYILRKYQESYQSNQIVGFYQEYFHIVSPQEEKSLNNPQFANIRFFITPDGTKWIAVRFAEGGEEVVYNVNTYAGVDPASANTSNAKYSVIAFVAVNAYRQFFFIGYSRGKFGFRDELAPDVTRGDGDIVIPDRSKVSRIGIVDEEVRLAKQYKYNSVTIETTQQQQSVYDEVLRIMRKNRCYHSVIGEKPSTDKIDRDADILMPLFQSKSLFINYGLEAFLIELKAFPRGKTVDIIDALAYACKNARAPSAKDFASHKGRVSRRVKEEEYGFAAL